MSEQTPATPDRVPVATQPELYARLRSSAPIFDTLGDGLILVESEQRVLFCNEMARVLLGNGLPDITAPEWTTRYHYLLPDGATPSHPEDLPLLRALRGEAMTRREMHVSGEGIRNVWLSVTSRPILDARGRFEWAYLVIRDINLRVWSEERMRLLERAMANASEGLVILDARQPNLPVIYASDGVRRLTGFEPAEVIGRTCEFLLGPAADTAQAAEALAELRRERPVAMELRSHRQDGSEFWNRLSITPVRDSAGALTHYVAVMSDISELIDKEEQLKEATRKLQAANRQITWANQHMKSSLLSAAQVQRAMLPSAPLDVDGAHFAWVFRPEEELSGDFLNVVPLDDDSTAVYLLDVTGHGVASAMVCVAVSRLLLPTTSATALVYERVPGPARQVVASPGKVATRLAMRFPWDPQSGQFFTMIYAVLNTRTREFRYACAGHLPPVCVTVDGAFIAEKTRDLPIGIGSGDYEDRTLRLEPGTRIYLYSDGITEARNASNELFGQQRLLDVLREVRPLSLEHGIQVLVDRLNAWREGGAGRDDISMVAVEMPPHARP